MYHAASSPGRSAPQSAYGFATPVRASSSTPNAYSQVLTSASTDASASKAVRFQNQPLAPQLSQPASAPAFATPGRPSYGAPATTTPSTVQTLSPRPNSASATAAAAKPPVTRSMGNSGASSSSLALARRVKWNVGALAALWLVPAVTSRPRDVYWSVLDAVYVHVGGNADELIDAIVGWILWALSVVLFFNVVEAAVMMRRTSAPQPPPPAPSTIKPSLADKAVLGIHSPQVAKSINFVAASRLKGSPKTRASNIGAGSPISHPTARASPTQAAGEASPSVDYSQFSPSLRRTSGPINATASNRTPRAATPSSNTRGESAGAQGGSSPLAAFRARHSSAGLRGSPSPASLRTRSATPATSTEADLSLGDLGDASEATFLGDESFEVDRALRSLRGSMDAVSSTPAPFR